MSIIARKNKEFLPAPVGSHIATCVDVEDLGELPSYFVGKPPQHKVRLTWQLPVLIPGTVDRFAVRKNYTLSLHEKSALRQDLQAWRGKPFSEQELKNGFDIEKVLGVGCLLGITHQVGEDGGTRAKVISVLPLPAETAKLVPQGYIRTKDQQTPNPMRTDGLVSGPRHKKTPVSMPRRPQVEPPASPEPPAAMQDISDADENAVASGPIDPAWDQLGEEPCAGAGDAPPEKSDLVPSF
jgi:hypothetical protein